MYPETYVLKKVNWTFPFSQIIIKVGLFSTQAFNKKDNDTRLTLQTHLN